MDKLELDLNDLKVDSFQADPQRSEARGTVRGNRTLDVDRCDTFITCDNSCGGTCDVTCFICDKPSADPDFCIDPLDPR